MKDKELREIVYDSFEEIAEALEKLESGDEYKLGILWHRRWQELKKKCKNEF
jgi:hypothetical protein